MVVAVLAALFAPAALAQTTPAPAPEPQRLTSVQYRALERLLEAGVANDRARPTPRAAALFARRCDGLGRRGAVLSAYQRLCAPAARLLVFINRGCDSDRSCRRQFAFQARSTRALLRAAPEANAELRRLLAPGACPRELTLSDRELRAERALEGYLDKAARLYGRVSDRRLERLFERKVGRFQKSLRTARERLRGLRRHCP